NLQRRLGRAEQPIILDPFCGTGTTLIDVAVRIPEAIVVGLDTNQLTPRLIKDNLRFFALDANGIHQLEDSINGICGRLAIIIGGGTVSTIEPIDKIVQASEHFDTESINKKA